MGAGVPCGLQNRSRRLWALGGFDSYTFPPNVCLVTMESPTLKVTVLLIEDDVAIRRLLDAAFQNTEFRLIEAETAAEGIEMVTRKRPDLILLDMGLPDAGGLSVIRTVRGWSAIPIIIVSGEGADDQKVTGLEAGADDYITKPFSINELMARMRVALRHSAQAGSENASPIFESGNLKVDRSSREVFVNGERVHLTPIEFKLLVTLVKHAGKVVTHRQLLAEVWGEEYSEEAQYLRVYIGYLRKKLEPEGEQPCMLLTEPRVGYRLAV